MRSFRVLFIILGLLIWGCGGGGSSDSSGFVPTGKIIAVAERNGSNVTIKVGGTEGSVPKGSMVVVTNRRTGETETIMAEADGSFDPTFTGSTNDTFSVVVSDNGTIIKDDIIGVTLISQAVKRDLAQLGSIPTAIEIQGNKAYVVNGGFNNIQIFDVDQNPPQEIGTIVLPPGSDPVGIAFLNDTIAYVSNNIGQNVAIVNVQTMQCETVITEISGDFKPCMNPPILVPEGSFEDPWIGIVITNGKVYVSNFNFDKNFKPLGNGFVTVINTTTNEVIKTIELSAEQTQGITVVGNKVYVVSAGESSFDTNLGAFIPVTDGAVDVIDPATDQIVAPIPIRLNPALPLVGSPNRLEPTPDGKFGYIGSDTAGVLFKVDLENNFLVRGTGDPIIITSAEQQDATFDVEIRDDGLAFIPVFNTDQVFVMNTKNDSINPFPFIAPFPAGQKADNPDSQFFEGVQNLAIRSEGDFPDIFFITGISSKLGSVNTTLILPPE